MKVSDGVLMMVVGLALAVGLAATNHNEPLWLIGVAIAAVGLVRWHLEHRQAGKR